MVAHVLGCIVWALPALSRQVLVLKVGSLAIAGSIFALLAGVQTTTTRSRWLLLIEGVLGVLAGMVALGWPALTVAALLLVIAAWAMATRIVEIAGAWRTDGGRARSGC
jgi:uncharacterized membrane protein HdeD (DUF308 family)